MALNHHHNYDIKLSSYDFKLLPDDVELLLDDVKLLPLMLNCYTRWC